MSYKIKSFKNFEKKEWNKLVSIMIGNQQHFTWNRIRYFETLPNIINLSFAVFEGKACLALVALGLSKINNKNIFSFNKDFCPEPIVNYKLTIYEKKKLKNNLRTLIENIAKEKNVKSYNLRTHPVIFEKNTVKISSQDQFYQIKWAKNFFVHNTIILNLAMKESEIWDNFSKSHKKNIKRISSKGLKFNVINSKASKSEISYQFQNFKKAHYLNWNKQTRPNENWDSMKNSLIDGEAILFTITSNQKDISFLFCGVHKKFCFGWSQANFKEYEKEYMPRHFLEWSVIKYLKKNRFSLYEIGERYYEYDNFSAPEKFFSISDFKEKFGGNFFPKVNFISDIK